MVRTVPAADSDLAVRLLRRSRLHTRSLFSAEERLLGEIRRVLGSEPPREIPVTFNIPGTDVPFDRRVRFRLRKAPLYCNLRLRHDRYHLQVKNGSYKDLSGEPVRLRDLVREGRIDIATLLGEEADRGTTYRILFAMSVFGEVRVAVRDRGIFHSSIFGPVTDLLAAGNIFVRDGQAVEADLGSGHFSPDQERSLRLLQHVMRETNIPGWRTLVLNCVGLTRDPSESIAVEGGGTPRETRVVGALYLRGEALHRLHLDRLAAGEVSLLGTERTAIDMWQAALEEARADGNAEEKTGILERLSVALQVEVGSLTGRREWREAALLLRQAAAFEKELGTLFKEADKEEDGNVHLRKAGILILKQSRYLMQAAKFPDRPDDPLDTDSDYLEHSVRVGRDVLSLCEDAEFLFAESGAETEIAHLRELQGRVMYILRRVYRLLEKDEEGEGCLRETIRFYRGYLSLSEGLGGVAGK